MSARARKFVAVVKATSQITGDVEMSTNWRLGYMFMASGLPFEYFPSAWPYVRRLFDSEPRALPLFVAKVFVGAPIWVFWYFAYVVFGKRAGFGLATVLAITPVLTSSGFKNVLKKIEGPDLSEAVQLSSLFSYTVIWLGVFGYLNFFARPVMNPHRDHPETATEAATALEKDNGDKPSLKSDTSLEQHAQATAHTNYVNSALLALLFAWFAGGACCRVNESKPSLPSEQRNKVENIMRKIDYGMSIVMIFSLGSLVVFFFQNATRWTWHLLAASSAGIASFAMLRATSTSATVQSQKIDAALVLFSSALGLVVGVFSQNSRSADKLYATFEYMFGHGDLSKSQELDAKDDVKRSPDSDDSSVV